MSQSKTSMNKLWGRVCSSVMVVMLLFGTTGMSTIAASASEDAPPAFTLGRDNIGEIVGSANVQGVDENGAPKRALLKSAPGSMATITPTKAHYYGGWSTNEFNVAAETGNYLGFCAQPNEPTPSGTYAVAVLNDEAIKFMLVAYQHYLEGPSALLYSWAQRVFNEKDNNMYAYAHAAIGYKYAGSLTGLSPSMADGVKNMVDNWAIPDSESMPEWLAVKDQYVAYVAMNSAQDIVWVEKAPTGSMEIIKRSASPCLSEGNGAYSLADAQFTLVGQGKSYSLTTAIDENGVAKASVDNVPFGTYTLTETNAPRGYVVASPMDVVVNKPGVTQVTVFDQPMYDPVGISLSKVDKITGETAQGGASLLGAIFHFDFYAEQLTKEQIQSGAYAPALSFDTKTVANSKGQAKVNLNKDVGCIIPSSFTASNGSALSDHYDADGDFMFPMGTVSIYEKAPSEGYTLEGIVISDKTGKTVEENFWSFNITDEGSTNLGVLNHVDELSQTQGEVIRGDIQIQKWDKELDRSESIGGADHKAGSEKGADLNGIEFTITNRSADGVYVDGTLYKSGDVVKVIKTHWNEELGAYTAETSGKALPYGDYGVKETKSNDSYLLTDSKERLVQIREDGAVVTTDENGKDLIYKNQVKRGDIKFNKIVGGVSARVNTLYTLTNVTTSEKHVIVSDKNGEFYSDVNDGELHTKNTNANDGLLALASKGKAISMKDVNHNSGTWFGVAEDGSISNPNDGLCALPYGEYALDELRTDTNKGLALQHFTFSIFKNNKVVNLGTITDTPVNIATTATDSKTGTHTALAAEDVVLTDTVKYEGLSVGTKYTLTGTLMVRETGEALVDEDGNLITASTTFTAKTTSGTEVVTFKFDASKLQGQTLVVFESLLDVEADDIVATHEDIDDDGQSVHFPEIGTTLTDEEGEHTVFAAEDLTLYDTVAYKNLIPGEEYTVHGILMDKATGEEMLDKDGKAIVASTTFTPEESDGTVVVEFKFDATVVAGKTVVAFETLKSDGKEVAVHADIEDKDQTVDFPEIKTTAVDKATGTKAVESSKTATVVDTVSYTNLTVDKTYTLTGTLMDKETKKPLLDKDGKEITSTTEFTPKETSGVVELEFVFDATLLQGHTIVVFEKVTVEGKDVAVHTDIDDEDQSVYVLEIHTTATSDNLRDKSIAVGGNQTIIDTVAFKNLIIGHEYQIEGTLMNKATGTPVLSEDGEPVVSRATFTPTETTGSVQLPFVVNTSKLAGTTLVVFEKIYSDKHVLVGQHEDIDDEGQSVVVKNPELITTAVQTGIEVMSGPLAVAVATMLIASIGLFVVARRAKKGSNAIK